MSSTFKFKQFSINQDLCAMKVGTDGVLLGAWSDTSSKNVLDVGCGSGVISLMIAQRNAECLIDAIDINENAYKQTVSNIEVSPWGDRITVHKTSIQDFKTNKKYHLIISNPPFFENAFKAPDKDKNIARHTDELPFNDLIKSVTSLLHKDGIFSLILPIESAEKFENLALNFELHLIRKCTVYPNGNKKAKRALMSYSFNYNETAFSTLTIETETRHQYTEEYRNLTKDFYLKF